MTCPGCGRKRHALEKRDDGTRWCRNMNGGQGGVVPDAKAAHRASALRYYHATKPAKQEEGN